MLDEGLEPKVLVPINASDCRKGPKIYQTNLQTLNRNTQMSDSSYGKTMINIDFEYCRASAIAIAKKWEFNEFNENKAIAICAKENNHRLDILILWQIQTATYKYV